MFQTRTDILLTGALDGLAARHRKFVQNIANAETPGYQPVDVAFEGQLRELSRQLDVRPNSGLDSSMLNLSETPDEQSADRPDDNGVQVDSQVIRLEENTITYEALTQSARMRDGMLKSAITEGKK